MIGYLKKKELVEWLDQRASNLHWGARQADHHEIIDKIQSGAFDADNAEIQRLLAALMDTSLLIEDMAVSRIDDFYRLRDNARAMVAMIHSDLSTTSEPTGTQLADEQGYHEWVLGGLINATNEIQRLRSVFSSRGVFNALRYYQKQGLCEGNEYEEIENALEALSAKTSTGEQREIEQEE